MRLIPIPLAAAAIVAGLACSSGTDSSSGGAIPGLQVTVGNNLFRSTNNSTENPAIDTVAVGDTVSWVWTNTGGTPHSVESDPPNPGDPAFTSSATLTGNGKVHTVVFPMAGEYEYDCAVHGSAVMSGKVVVQ